MAGHDDPCPAAPRLGLVAAVTTTATGVPGARSGANWPGFNPNGTTAWPGAGIAAPPTLSGVSSAPGAKLVAIRRPWSAQFSWPAPSSRRPPTVGDAVRDLMAAGGWPGADAWAARACGIAPTIVGGSQKHGGPDLGPTRSRQAWAALGVDGLGVADHPPGPDFPPGQPPKLTVAMVSRLQGFPDGWSFSGRKTAAYRQVGNAFPPPVARALGTAIRQALEG